MLKQARGEMAREGAGQLGTDHLLLGLLLEGGSRVTSALEALGLSYRVVREAMSGAAPEI